MKILLQYLGRYKALVFLTLILATINQVFSLFDPYFFGRLLDRFAKNPDKYSQHEFMTGIMGLLGMLIGVAMVSRIAKAFQDYTSNLIIQKLGADIYTFGLRHSLLMPFSEFEDQRSGETLNILQKVRTDAEKFIMLFVNVLFTSLVGVIFVVVFALNTHPIIVILYVVSATIISVVITFLSRKIKKVQNVIFRETKALAGATTESLRNIELIKSLGLTTQETSRLNETTRKILKLELKKVRSIRSISFAQGTMINFMRQSMLFVLLLLIFHKELSIGQMITLQFYSFFIFGPLQEIGSVLIAYREAQSSLENFEKIVSTPVEHKPENPHDLGPISNLDFDHVSFQHKTAHQQALTDVNFTVNNGETIAFVGPSGSGKSTLVKLLVGLYRPVYGSIRYNGIDGDEIDREELQRQLGFVTQDTQLFAGTIRENLLFVKPDATVEDLQRALKQASCETIISRSPEGLDTVIGEGGMKLSGGEKQRLSIARALLRSPKILVFDEATSALDSITEEAISDTIRDIGKNKDQITVLIAHRLSTVMHADKIYVLEKGQIIETGCHNDLLDEKGLYYAIV